MIAQLVLKEIKQNSFLAKKGVVKKMTSLLSSLVLLALFIALEVILYINVYDKVNIYTDFNSSLFVVLIFALFLIGLFSAIPLIFNAFFKNEKEKIIIGTSPASTYDIIFAKSASVYLKLLIFTFTTIYPLSLAYGLKAELGFLFHCLMFFACLVIPFLLESFGSLLTIPFKEVRKFIVRYRLLSFIIMMAFLLAVAFLYGSILNLFVDLIRSDDLGAIFTTSSVETLKTIANYLYPVKNFIDFALLKEMNVNFVISLAFIIFSFVISIFIFNRYLTSYYRGGLEKVNKRKNNVYSIKISSINYALIKKELNLALNNSEGIFSYITLIILQPFLVFSVVSAVNLIFGTGNLNYISTLFPSIFLTVDVILILLFLSVINTTSSMSLTKEKNTLIIMKTMPVSYFKQLLIKISVPSILSFISFLVTMIVLVSFGEIDRVQFLFLIVIGIIFIVLLNVISLYNDLKSKGMSSFLSLLVGFVLPIVSVLVGALLSLLVEASLETFIFFISIIALNLIALSFFLVKIKSRITRLFMLYEGEAR